MTISSTTRKAGPFDGNGVTTSFPFTFKVFNTSDITIVRTMPSGLEETLVLDSDYSVTLNGDQDANPGGTITYPVSGAPLPEDWRLTAVGALDFLQPTDITNGGGFYPQVIENALDRVTMLIQQLDEEIDRTIRIAVSDDATTGLELPAQSGRAGSILGFDADGNFTTYDRATATVQTTYQQFSATAGQTSFTLPNTYTPGANALYVWLNGAKLISGTDFTETTSTSFTLTNGAQARDVIEAIAGVPIANGTVIGSDMVSYTPAGTGAQTSTVQAKLREVVSVNDFGAVGDGVANDTSAVQAAVTAAGNRRITGTRGPFAVTALSDNLGAAFDDNIQIVKNGLLYNTRAHNQMVWGGEHLYGFYTKLTSRSSVKVLFTGDSTTYGGGPGDIGTIDKIIRNTCVADGLANVTTVNGGRPTFHSGDWDSTYVDLDIAEAPDVFVVRWGLNDPGAGRSLAQLATSLRSGLAKIRAAFPLSSGVSIVLMSPNAASYPNACDEVWAENAAGIFRRAARDYNCAYIDTYALFQNSADGSGRWMDGLLLHPLTIYNMFMGSVIYDLLFPSVFRLNFKTVGEFAPTLLNSWVDYDAFRKGASYYMDSTGRVHVSGVIKGGTRTSPTVLFTLPAAFRPKGIEVFTCSFAGSPVRVAVNINGDVFLPASLTGSGTDPLELGNISFAPL